MVSMPGAPVMQWQQELCLERGNPLLGLHSIPACLSGLLGTDEENVLAFGRDHDLPVSIAQADRLFAAQCLRHRSSSSYLCLSLAVTSTTEAAQNDGTHQSGSKLPTRTPMSSICRPATSATYTL